MSIFAYETQDLDLKESIKLKTHCQQLDTIVLSFNIYDYDVPVDLTNFMIEFRAIKPDGTLYSQVEDITKVSSLLTISCNNQLTAINGRTNCQLRIFDNLGNQKSSYFIVLNVTGIISDEDRVISRTLIDSLEHLDNSINRAIQINQNFDNDIDTANVLDLAFQSSISTAQDLENAFNIAIENASANKTALDNSNTIALSTKSALDASNSNALNAKTAVDLSVTNANTIKNEVDLAKISANIDKDTLITTIANANTELQEFKNYDTTQLVPLSNTMLNEMYCNNELLSINHGLNGYPIVKMTYTEYGAGIGGAGDFPAGADSDCNLMQNKTIYTDNNNLKIFVPQNYYIALPSINKINNYKYVVTFTNSTRSILIELIEGGIEEDINLINKSLLDLNYQNAQGTANAITLTVNKTLINGYSLTFIANANNSGNPTTVNGKYLYKPNTTTSPILKEGKAYTIWYNSTSDCFFIKASAVGNTIASHVLAQDTFSNDEDTELVGTMPKNGILSYNMPINGNYNIPLGYTDGGIINQNIPIKDTTTYTPTTSNQIISANQYLNGDQTILGDSDLIASNIIDTANIFGIQGTANVRSLGGTLSTSITTPFTSVSSITVSFPDYGMFFEFIASLFDESNNYVGTYLFLEDGNGHEYVNFYKDVSNNVYVNRCSDNGSSITVTLPTVMSGKIVTTLYNV